MKFRNKEQLLLTNLFAFGSVVQFLKSIFVIPVMIISDKIVKILFINADSLTPTSIMQVAITTKPKATKSGYGPKNGELIGRVADKNACIFRPVILSIYCDKAFETLAVPIINLKNNLVFINFGHITHHKSYKFSNCNVNVCISRSRFWNTSTKLGVRKTGQKCSYASYYERDHDTWTGIFSDHRSS
ncbi:hypothetical protein BpHYR1_048027 [Brachionus plicatilis]|uniref:Uncharacterized protein n=1 Tax=Brachionus plicatilis TaxID=10195 RepID=A0A3M7T9I5_BRAPC|nr:hypothetical protein BpHYR1_048027 [Brachionus plicatilis]